MKIVVVGAGSLGCLLGGKLLQGGSDVWYIDVWQEQVDVLNEHGLTLIDIEDNKNVLPVKATTTIDKGMANPDLIIMLVKAYTTDNAARTIREIVGSNTAILTLQNGLGNVEILKNYFSAETIYAGTTNMGAFLLECGVVQQGGVGQTTIGSVAEKNNGKLRQIVDAFNNSGLEARECDNVETLIWDKLIVNVAINALAAFYGFPSGKLLEFDETRTFMHQLIKEAESVARELGIKLTYKNQVERVEKIAVDTAKTYCSMVLDIQKGKRTEIDFINGAIVEAGKKAKVFTPYNEAATLLIKTFEKLSSY